MDALEAGDYDAIRTPNQENTKGKNKTDFSLEEVTRFKQVMAFGISRLHINFSQINGTLTQIAKPESFLRSISDGGKTLKPFVIACAAKALNVEIAVHYLLGSLSADKNKVYFIICTWRKLSTVCIRTIFCICY